MSLILFHFFFNVSIFFFMYCLLRQKCFLLFNFFFQEENRVSVGCNMLAGLLSGKIIGKQGWAGGRLNL